MEAATLQISGTPTFVLARSAKERLDGIRIIGSPSFSCRTFKSKEFSRYGASTCSTVTKGTRRGLWRPLRRS